jgi:hypothetical protein
LVCHWLHTATQKGWPRNTTVSAIGHPALRFTKIIQDIASSGGFRDTEIIGAYLVQLGNLQDTDSTEYPVLHDGAPPFGAFTSTLRNSTAFTSEIC